MKRISVLGRHLSKKELEALVALAKGVDPSCEIETLDAIGDPDPEVEDSVVLFLGCPAIQSAPELEECLAAAAKGARRAVWVWPEDAAASELPPPAAKYCYSCVPWDASKLGSVLADDDVTCFELPTGKPIPKVTTERNLCAEEETGAK